MISKQLSQKLNAKGKKPLPLKGYTSSAVLVPLFCYGKTCKVLYTRRTEKVRNHKNQISFPGGVREKQDRSLKITALRETEEEVGLNPSKIKILGKLQDIYTPTRFRITPFVGLVAQPPPLVLNPYEIQEIIEVPLKHLLDPRNMDLEPSEFYGPRFEIPTFHFRGHKIWGATGRITRELMETLHKCG